MAPSVLSRETASPQDAKLRKIDLEVVALDNTWLLVRTDDSPQKKAVLKRGESLTWRADERFLLSYERAGAIKLLLNGTELTVEGPRETVVRDLAITRAGIVGRSSARTFQPRRKKPQQTDQPQPVVQQPQPAAEQARDQQAPAATILSPKQEQQPVASDVPASTPPQEAPQAAPQQAPSQ